MSVQTIIFNFQANVLRFGFQNQFFFLNATNYSNELVINFLSNFLSKISTCFETIFKCGNRHCKYTFMSERALGIRTRNISQGNFSKCP